MPQNSGARNPSCRVYWNSASSSDNSYISLFIFTSSASSILKNSKIFNVFHYFVARLVSRPMFSRTSYIIKTLSSILQDILLLRRPANVYRYIMRVAVVITNT